LLRKYLFVLLCESTHTPHTQVLSFLKLMRKNPLKKVNLQSVFLSEFNLV
jgi:hypothetical protein